MTEQLKNGSEAYANTSAETRLSTHAILYMLAGIKGLGHTSRALAINHFLAKDTPIIYSAAPIVHPFLKESISLQTNAQVIPLLYTRDTKDENLRRDYFLEHNQPLFSTLNHADFLVLDYLAEIMFLEQYRIERGLDRMPLLGIYHSFEGDYSQDPDILGWQAEQRKVADILDAVFLIDPIRPDKNPFYTKNATYIIPCPPIVRPVTKSTEVVKAEYGIDPSKKCILIEGGIRVRPNLVEFIKSVTRDYRSDVTFVIQGEVGNIPDHQYPDNVVFLPKVINDIHHLIAASDGVICKPGMQTLSECLAYRTPILFLPDIDIERKIKVIMLRTIIGDNNPVLLDLEKDIGNQLDRWMDRHDVIKDCFQGIRADGAAFVADKLMQFRDATVSETQHVFQTQEMIKTHNSPFSMTEGNDDYQDIEYE